MSVQSSPEEEVLKTDLHIQAAYRLTEALVTSEKKMRRRIELLSEVVFEVDSAGIIRYLNRAWNTLLGYDLSSSIGTPLRDYVIEDDRIIFSEYLTGASKGEEITPLEVRLSTKNATVVVMEMSTAGLEEGGMVGTLYNVTQQNQTRAELAKLSLVASTTDSMVVITNAKGETEWVNQAVVNKTGYTLEEFLGHKPGALLQGPDTDPKTVREFSESLRSSISFQCEILNYTKSGQEYWVAIFVTPVFSAAGELERFIAVQNDVTLVRQMQHDLQVAKDAAERASQAKSVFLAAMSHEIRTPLNGVLGMLSLLQEGQLNDEQRRRANIIKDSGEALVTIVNDILDYSKIESGRFSLTSERFFVKALLDETVNLFRGNAEAKDLKLSSTFIGDERIAVIGDRGRLRQVLMNLVNNAVKFTLKGAIHVEVVQERVGKEIGLRVRVSDTGIGIAEQDLDRLFVHFSQVDASPTRKQGGTGLGLAISKQLVGMMAGDIGVETKQGEGSTFWFKVRLPKARSAKTAAKPQPTQNDFTFTGLRALIAEDNMVNQIVLKGILDSVGVDSEIAENGREAVSEVNKGRFDFVLMDVHMPEMDGLEATRTIRQTSQIPIIAVTANVLSEQIQVCYDCGMNGFVPKPISRQSIQTELSRVLTLVQPAL